MPISRVARISVAPCQVFALVTRPPEREVGPGPLRRDASGETWSRPQFAARCIRTTGQHLLMIPGEAAIARILRIGLEGGLLMRDAAGEGSASSSSFRSGTSGISRMAPKRLGRFVGHRGIGQPVSASTAPSRIAAVASSETTPEVTGAERPYRSSQRQTVIGFVQGSLDDISEELDAPARTRLPLSVVTPVLNSKPAAFDVANSASSRRLSRSEGRLSTSPLRSSIELR